MIITADQGREPEKLYIAGPMTGLPDHNFPAFHRVAAIVRELGFTVLNPAELVSEPPYNKPWDFYMRKALALLLCCDSILMLNNWTESKGAKIEWTLAQELGMKVYHESKLKAGKPL